MKRLVLSFTLFILLALNFNLRSQTNIYGELEFGTYPVGFKEITHEINSKKLKITLWYPALQQGIEMTLSDLIGESDNTVEELRSQLSISISGEKNSFTNDTLDLLLNSRLKSVFNPPELAQEFPLLLWSVRYGTVEYQFLISEYLASYGYVVAFMEDVPPALYPWEIKNEEAKSQTLRSHLKDMYAAMGLLVNRDNINPDKIGLLSWSYGGESALLAQMERSEINLVVGLSSIGFNYGIYTGVQWPSMIEVNRLDVPYLIMTERIAPNGNPRKTSEIFYKMNPSSRLIYFEKLGHGNFNVLEGMIPGILNSSKVQPWSTGGLNAQLGFEAICKLTLNFIQSVWVEMDDGYFDNRLADLRLGLPDGFINPVYIGEK